MRSIIVLIVVGLSLSVNAETNDPDIRPHFGFIEKGEVAAADLHTLTDFNLNKVLDWETDLEYLSGETNRLRRELRLKDFEIDIIQNENKRLRSDAKWSKVQNGVIVTIFAIFVGAAAYKTFVK